MLSITSTKTKFHLLSAAIFLLFAAALLSPVITPYNPYDQNLLLALQPPDTAHWLGTDRYGRDILSRIIIGAPTTLGTAVMLVLGSACCGTFIGIICGYHGGRIDNLLMRLSDVFLAFPGLILAIAVASVAGGLWTAALALAAVLWPKYARLARSQTLAIRSLPYVDAAKMSGATSLSIIKSCILPNICGPLIVTAALDIGTAIMEMAGLSFLGLGAAPPAAEWGLMISSSRNLMQTAPWLLFAPGGAIFITVALFHLWSDALRDRLDPQFRSRP